MVKVLQIPNSHVTCCFRDCDTPLYMYRNRRLLPRRRKINSRKGYAIGTKRALKIFVYHNIIVSPSSIMCLKHNQLSPKEFEWDANYVLLSKLEDLPNYAQQTMNRARDSLKEHFEIIDESRNVHLSFHRISSSRCKVLTGLESDNITEVIIVRSK